MELNTVVPGVSPYLAGDDVVLAVSHLLRLEETVQRFLHRSDLDPLLAVVLPPAAASAFLRCLLSVPPPLLTRLVLGQKRLLEWDADSRRDSERDGLSTSLLDCAQRGASMPTLQANGTFQNKIERNPSTHLASYYGISTRGPFSKEGASTELQQ